MAYNYNYSLVHQQPGIPLTQTNRQPHYILNQEGVPLEEEQAGKKVVVTEDLLLELTYCDTLDEIRVISLRNKLLQTCLRQLSACDSLGIAYLQGNRISTQDLMYLQTFTHLKKIDLSFNQISALPSPAVFQELVSLKFLYLHNNNISNWSDLKGLSAIPNLLHLTLFSNPVCTVPGFRHFMVNSNMSLLALDNYVITDEERIEDASFGYRFRGLNEFMILHIPDYAKEKSAEQHLFNLEVDVYRLKRIFERNSPSILIQSLYRGYRQRNFMKIYFNERKKSILKIQKVVRGWLMRKKLKNDLKDMLSLTHQEDLLLTNKEIRRRDAAILIQRFVVRQRRKRAQKKKEQRSSLIIQRFYKGRFIKNTSFIHCLQLHKYPRIYFLKEQKPIFIQIIKERLKYLTESSSYTYEEILSFIKEDHKYETIRVSEPDLFKYKSLPLVQFVKPSLESKVRFTKSSPLEPELVSQFHLKDYYFSNNKSETDRLLAVLKKRNCSINASKMAKFLKKSQKNPFKNQLIFYDQYQDLLMFECPKLELLITLCFAILDRNRQAQYEDEAQFLTYYDALLIKVSCATRIQMAFRSYLQRQKDQKLAITHLIERRAAFCIQRWWSNLKLQKRMVAMEKIKKHIERIRSPIVYVEQGLYSTINELAFKIHQQLKFEEQHLSFDFAQNAYQIFLVIQEKDKPAFRYVQQSLPRWFGLTSKVPEFPPTPQVNNILSFFHYNDQGCQLVPATKIIKAERNQMDVDRKMNFLRMKCFSVDEAKRRAAALALLTYDIHKHLFIQLNTEEMLEDPFLIANIYDMKRRFSLGTDLDHEWDIGIHLADQMAQEHSGLLLSDKDSRLIAKSGLSYKRVELEVKAASLTCKDYEESQRMEKEIQRIQLQTQESIGSKGILSFYETRKLKESHLSMMKAKRMTQIREATNAFKIQKEEQKSSLHDQFEQYLIAKREEVNKAREIQKIISNEQRGELDKNLSVFLGLNKEEKNLRRELVDKQLEVDYKEKFLKKVGVLQQHKNRQLKREEQEKFVNAFSQAKNLIEKQIKIGRKLRLVKDTKKTNQERVQNIRSEKSLEKQAVKSVVYDTSFDLSMIQNQRGAVSREQARISNLYSSKRKVTTDGDYMKNYTTAITHEESIARVNRSMNRAPRNVGPGQYSYFLPPLNDSSLSEHFRSNEQNVDHTYNTGIF